MNKDDYNLKLELKAIKTCKNWKAYSNKKRVQYTCRNCKCGWVEGYYLSNNGWQKLKNWSSIHVVNCPYSGQRVTTTSFLRRKAATITLDNGKDSLHEVISTYLGLVKGVNVDLNDIEKRKLENTLQYVKKQRGLTRSLQMNYFDEYLNELKFNGYTVEKNPLNGSTVIITPYGRDLLSSFPNPAFIDGTFSNNKKIIIHVCIVTTDNVIILIGLVICDSENAQNVKLLLNKLIIDKTITFISDEGLGITKAIKSFGPKCCRALCAWHLSRQLPHGKGFSDTFFDASRGVIRYEDFLKLFPSNSKIRINLDRKKNMWCARFILGMRRGYVSSLSESINGSIKKKANSNDYITLTKLFISQSRHAYNMCCETASKLSSIGYMPDAIKYYEEAIKSAKKLRYVYKNRKYHIYKKKLYLAVVSRVAGRLVCDCNRNFDIGLPCCHIMAIETVNINDYAHDIWLTKTYKEAFAFRDEVPEIQTVPHSAVKKMRTDKDIAISAIRDSATFSHEKCELIQMILSSELDKNKLQDILTSETQGRT